MTKSRNLFTALLIAIIPFGLSGCGGDTHEAVMNDMIELMGEVATIIESAKDKESAEAAAKKIDGLTSSFEALAKRAEALGEPSEADAKKLMESSAATLGPVMMKMMGAAAALQANPEAAEVLGPAMERFQKASSGAFGG